MCRSFSQVFCPSRNTVQPVGAGPVVDRGHPLLAASGFVILPPTNLARKSDKPSLDRDQP